MLLFGQYSSITTLLPLDGVTGALAAYSTRKLRTAYAGFALKVQRLSDNAQQDIGFAADGSLDSATLASFGTSADCRVITWYDQVGSANVTQATATSAPQIRNASTNQVINSTRLALTFNGFVLDTGGGSTIPTNVRHWFCVANVTDTTGQRGMIGASANGGIEWRVQITTPKQELLKQATASIGISTSAITANTAGVFEVTYDATNYSFFKDGAADGSGTNAQTISASTLVIGGQASAGEPWIGQIGELVITDVAGDISAATRQAIEANMKAFWGTP